MTISTGAALAPDDEPPGNEDAGISVDAATSGETGASFVFVPHVIGGISLAVAPEVISEGIPAQALADDRILSPDSRPDVSEVHESESGHAKDYDARGVGWPVAEPTTTAAPPAPPAAPRLPRADRVRGALPLTGPGLTGLGGVLLGCLVAGMGAAVDLGFGDGLGTGFTATFLVGCVLVASTVRTRALAIAMVLPPLLFAAGYAWETKSAGQTTGRREMALDVATSLALHAPVLFVGTALAVAVVVVRVLVHLIRR